MTSVQASPLPAQRIQVRAKRICADHLTPVLLYLALRDDFSDPVLLESNETRDNEHYFSVLGLETLASIQVQNGAIQTSRCNGNRNQQSLTGHSDEAAAALEDFLASFELQGEELDDLASKFNGLVGHTNFEGAQYFDTLSFDNPKVLRSPDIRYHLYRFVLVFHHYRDELLIIENIPEGDLPRIGEVESAIKRGGGVHPFLALDDAQSNLTDETYMEMVRQGKRHCQRGDVFQLVLSRQFSQSFRGDEFQVYRALRSINPSPYLFYFDYGDYRIMGSSPESQLVIQDGTARLNPIAGTYRRTGDAARDAAATEELLADPKENAEHIMLVDLARNDLSRHTKEVRVKSLREVHYYSHVIHLVSTVEGKLGAVNSAVRIFGDTFPAGTLSGAPKYRAMELINTYENVQRGFYGGAIGMIDFQGGMNQAILIRSFFSQDNKLHYQAGAGIVAASEPQSECQEVYNKLGALTKAINRAQELTLI